MDKNKIIPPLSQTTVIVSAEFKTFKDNFLSCFIFKPIERIDFNSFLSIQFQVYNILYKNLYTIKEYSKITLNEAPWEFESYGMELKPE